MKTVIQIKSLESVLLLLRKWKKRKQENFLVITLNDELALIKVHHISKGLVNETFIHPRECFYPVVKDLAVAMILVHNHPSGNASSSAEDDKITERMSMAAEIMGIHLLDHIIITPGDDYYSYRQANKLSDKHDAAELGTFVKSLDNCYRNN